MTLQLLLILLLSSPDAVYLRHVATVELSAADRGCTERTSELIVPLTAMGVQRYGTISSTYWSGWESLEVSASIAHWRPGRGEEQAEVSEEPHSSLLPGGRLESSLREVHIRFPGMESGDTLKVEITRRIRRIPLGDFYSFNFYAASRDSIHSAVLTLLSDPGTTVHAFASEGTFRHGDYIDSEGVQRRMWESGPQHPLPWLPFSPHPVLQSPRVSVATHTPHEVSRGLWASLVEGCLDEWTGAADAVMEAAGPDPRDLCLWVSEEIEYLGAERGGDPGYTPRRPLETLEDRTGVCRDRAVLLIWLLRGAGYHPFAVLTSHSAPPGPFPGSRSFDHMLVGLRGEEGDTLFLDPTNPLSTDGYTYTLRGREYLPLTPEGAGMAVFPDPGEGDTLDIMISGRFSEDLQAITGDITVRFSGASEELFRSMLSSVDADATEELLQRLFGALPGSRLSLSGDPASPRSKLEVSGNGTWACHRILSGDSSVVILPGLSSIDLAGARAAAYILPPFREHLFIETPYTSRLRITAVNLPEGTPSLPAALDTGMYSVSVDAGADTLVLSECLSLLPVYPDPADTGNMRKAAIASISSAHRTVTFR